MVTEDYVSYEVAKLLKEKGFDELCYACYEYFRSNVTMYSGWPFEYKGEPVHNTNNRVKCPTLQMAMKWLREVYNKHIYVVPVVTDDDGVMGYWWEDCIITNRRYNSIRTGKLYNSPEEAYEAAIKYCLTNLI